MKKFAALLPLTAGALWGSVGIFVRKMTAFGMDNSTILFARMFLGVLIMLAGLLVLKREFLQVKAKDIGIIIFGAVTGNLGLSYFYNDAMNRLTLSFAAVLLSTFPIFVMFFAAILFKEKITHRKVLCTGLAITGCVLVSGFLEANGEITWTAAGIAAGVAASFCYGLYSIMSKMIMQRGYHSITITFYFMLVISAVLAPFTDFRMIADFVTAAPVGNTALLLGHSALCAVIPYVIYTMSFNYMDSGKAAILAAIEPAAAMIFGVLFFNEIPTILMVCGMLLTIAALSVLCLPAKKECS